MSREVRFTLLFYLVFIGDGNVFLSTKGVSDVSVLSGDYIRHIQHHHEVNRREAAPSPQDLNNLKNQDIVHSTSTHSSQGGYPTSNTDEILPRRPVKGKFEKLHSGVWSPKGESGKYEWPPNPLEDRSSQSTFEEGQTSSTKIPKPVILKNENYSASGRLYHYPTWVSLEQLFEIEDKLEGKTYHQSLEDKVQLSQTQRKNKMKKVFRKMVHLQKPWRSKTLPKSNSIHFSQSPVAGPPVVDDPYFIHQFYMFNIKRSPGQLDPYDLNILDVWTQYKIFGEGVLIVILGDGLETKHPELRSNFNENFVLNLVDGNENMSVDPGPDDKNHVSTLLAGLIAMEANNGFCGAGVAPLAKLGAIKIDDNAEYITTALKFKSKRVHIMLSIIDLVYGPEAESPLTTNILQAFKRSVIKGRGSKGVVYVIPAGEDGGPDRMCGRSIFLNTIYTIGVTGSNFDGSPNQHAEHCAAIMVTAYSLYDDYRGKYSMVSSGTNGKCTTMTANTGGAAALVSGIIALVLQARPNLTWRDVQHLIVQTSNPKPLFKNRKLWKRNAVGTWYSETFGFGMIDAYILVKTAFTFKPIGEMVHCTFVGNYSTPQIIPHERHVTKIKSTVCYNSDHVLRTLEHVQLQVSLTYPNRGRLKIQLQSARGTIVTLLDAYPPDKSDAGMKDWLFDSVIMWGEGPLGDWFVYIDDTTGEPSEGGMVEEIKLHVYGPDEIPEYARTPKEIESLSRRPSVRE